MSLRNITIAVSTVFIAAVIALSATIYFSDRDVGAQTAPRPAPARPTAPAPAAPRPEAQQRPAAAPAAPSGPVRTETITYDSWTVTCRDTADGKSKKVCAASLAMVAEQQNQRINLGAWVIAKNNEGALVSVVQTPQINVGVLVTKGVDLKLGDKSHPIAFVDCNPQHCEASMPMNEGFIKEALAAANGPATVTFWKTDGAEFNINIQSIKGIDKAIAAVR